MSHTPLERFRSAVNTFDSFIDSLPESVGAREMQDLMRDFSPKLVSGVIPRIFMQ
jgi:hypothetical protein